MEGIVILVVLVIIFVLAACFAGIADIKGCSEQRITVVWLSILFGPVGWIYAAALPDVKARPVNGNTVVPAAVAQREEKQYVAEEDLPEL